MEQKNNPWSLSPQEVAKNFEVNPELGLSFDEVKRRRAHFGENTIITQKLPSLFTVFIRQFKSLLVGLLAVAGIVAGVSGDSLDAFAIFIVIFVNAAIGFVAEVRAMSSMESLRKMGRTESRVLREGRQQLVSSEDLVPGDLLLLDAGDVVTADCRVFEQHNFNVDESILTGESVPVEKVSDLKLDSSANIFERRNIVMKGTHVTKGVGTVIVTHTGMNTELGKIATLTASDDHDEMTPLEKRLNKLGNKLVWLIAVICVLIFFSGWMSGQEPLQMVQMAIALAVATVPEGLPIVATIALAKGLWTMAKKNALVKRLSAVETLGATSIIIADKTGTLTENKMSVSEVQSEEGEFERLVEVIALCNDAQYGSGEEAIGDPMEIALLEFALKNLDEGVDLKTKYPRISETPFDSLTKMMATYHKKNNHILVAVKGAPEAVIDICDLENKEEWKKKNLELSKQGLRVLAVAYKETQKQENDTFSNLSFLGLVALLDPARKDVPQSIEQCKKAGIRVIMATGDQAGTAVKIASDIGLPEASLLPISGSDLFKPWSDELLERLQKTSVFCRVSPEQKLDLVEFYQKQGAIVAMTGDGVNDSPALKKADIGVAMGLRGTQVAREAADMILKDDRFETIVFAVEQGRIIYSNIRKFVIYLLSCNISEVFVVALAALFSAKIPITPLQILFLNLVTDIFPALALGMGRGDHSYLSRPPREYDEKIIEKTHWHFIFVYGMLITATVLGMFYCSMIVWQLPFEKAVTLSFLTLGFSQVFHVFNLRKEDSNFFLNDVTKNPYVWGAIVLCLLLFVGSVYIPIVQIALDLVPLSVSEWGIVVAASLIPVLGQFVLPIKYKG